MRPNILLITTDQQRGDCLSCDGHPVCETPNLDALAEKGFRFSRAYTSVPSCTPARSAIMTGMDQWNHGRLNMEGDDPLDWPQTLPGGLAAAGYHTQGVGKMHFYPQRRLYGFHNTILDESGRSMDGFVSDYIAWFEKNKTADIGYRDHTVDWNSWMARPSHLPEHLHPTYWTVNEGIRFVQSRDFTKPFFLWLSFARPHSPYDAPRPYWDMYQDADIPKPAVGDWCSEQDKPVADVNAPFSHRPWVQTRRARQGYYGNITFIDHQLGRFFYEMERLAPGQLDNTFVIFTSDHGDMMGDHHHWRKTYAFEGSSRIPFLVRPPKTWGLKRGAVIDKPVELRDILPTLWEAAGLQSPSTVDGSSLIPLMKDSSTKWRDFVHGEHTRCYTREYGQQWLTNGREKYVWFHHTGRELYFDLANDPQECRDLSKDAKHQPRIQELRHRLADILHRRGDPRGKDGKLTVVEQGLGRSPNYFKWAEIAAKTDYRRAQ
ncbi:MAG TPA: arylsulfatase [Planctomycetota bacterium]|nr:arylsulfatase [Planctomycetota bacterium]